MSPLAQVGYAAAGVVALVWLGVSFLRPGAGRNRLAWVGAVAMYVALLSLFLNLLRRSIEGDSMGGMIGFGFLATMFGLGLLLSVWKLFASLRAGGPGEASATH